MEIIAPILEIVKLAWAPIGRRIGYIKNVKRKMEELNKNAEYLFATRDDVKDKTSSSITKVATRECIQWLEDVKLIEEQVNVIREECKEDKKCLRGLCPNVYHSIKLGKHVKHIIKEITDLSNKQLIFMGNEMLDAPLEKVEPQFVQNVEISSSSATERTLQKILENIYNSRIQKVGIWGMGGVGKTTAMKLLNDQPEIKHAFEIVIWVTVSREGNRRKVQNDIADRLKLNVSNESDDRLQARICNTLRRKKFLLLLDDVWEMIDLCDVGIPALNHDNGCKVVLTTRSLSVCRQMETDEEIKVETLSKDEAWLLFKEKAGDVVLSPHIEPLARCIVKECDGLPLAIIVVGSSLRKNSDVIVWRNTLRELQFPTTSQIEAIEERVFHCLRFSYDRLKDDCKRKLFLYCSLYPEDYVISIAELVEYCWLEGYIRGVGNIEEARDKGHCMVVDLIDAAMLEGCYDGRWVKMHDVVRDFALREGRNFLVKAGINVRHPPEENEWLQVQTMSLIRSGLCGLLERPNCGALSTLLLQENNELTTIPKSFFESMHSLSILDLSGTKLQFLPPSIGNLVNLRGLYMRDCEKLEDLPSQIRVLKQLEVLHLGGRTRIKYLPREVGELTSLKRLILSFKHRDYLWYLWTGEDDGEWDMKLRVPTGVMPNLPLLEELGLNVNGCMENGQWDDESMEIVVDELCKLEHLTYLDFYFPNEACLEHFLRNRKSGKASWFRRFQFRVGAGRGLLSSGGREVWEGCLLYKGGEEISHVAIMETLAHCSTFYLQDHYAARILSEFGMANMNELKECRLIHCDEMETLFDGDLEQGTSSLLPNLEQLWIHELPKLRSLWVGSLLPGSLSRLEDLHLNGCHCLKKVFQLDIIQQLPNLKSLGVWSSSVEEIIGTEEEISVPHHDRVVLPNIKSIDLFILPKLASICREVSLELPSLERIKIIGCPELKSLSFLTDIVPPALKKIEGRSSWWEALEWEDNDIKQRLQPFFSESDW
ncbi:hypothetical protein AAC387_Pa02g0235 [Persea americana]